MTETEWIASLPLCFLFMIQFPNYLTQRSGSSFPSHAQTKMITTLYVGRRKLKKAFLRVYYSSQLEITDYCQSDPNTSIRGGKRNQKIKEHKCVCVCVCIFPPNQGKTMFDILIRYYSSCVFLKPCQVRRMGLVMGLEKIGENGMNMMNLQFYAL